MFSHVWLFTTPWTVALQAPLSMEFSREEYWSRLSFPVPVDLYFFFTFYHKSGVICISEVTDVYPVNLDSSLCFIQRSVSHDVLCKEAAEEATWKSNEGKFSEAPKHTKEKSAFSCTGAKGREVKKRCAWQQHLGFLNERTVCLFPKWLIVQLSKCQQVEKMPVKGRHYN